MMAVHVYSEFASSHKHRRRGEMQVALLKSERLDFADEVDTPLGVDTYYRPRSTEFPTIDSWLLVQPTPQSRPILIFQIVLNTEKHGVNKSGLDITKKLVTADTEKYLVVVTPERVQPKITVSREYLTKGS
jgi:hypothetical protein